LVGSGNEATSNVEVGVASGTGNLIWA